MCIRYASLKWTILALHLLAEYEHAISDPDSACSHFLIVFRAYMNTLFMVEVRILFLNDHIAPRNYIF